MDTDVPLTTKSQATTAILASEALGFSPQLLLDDIIDTTNNAVNEGIQGMETFLEKWTAKRSEKVGGEWDGTEELEQGLVSFQTLLEYNTDQAFDFFENWALRNIFSIQPGLPVVLPHQQGLDLTSNPSVREQELLAEIESLQKQLKDVCTLSILYPLNELT
jgi:kinetochore protein Mis12/MTW1